ncbi:MAG: exopolysaccharide biosynthesis polyprenyl glycosylphosphotransferase, partial [Candidatus Moranbacteria bacterium]|nr:exopolysaccharide biosynthesis polyprenyl glycosylphosphotransferase [Candidatus Moranbacteria bacterium]
ARYQVQLVDRSQILSKAHFESRLQVPEPASMLLFGSGFFTMILGFVRRTYAAIKRFGDIIGSLLGLLIFSPVMLIVAFLVKLTSPGPVFYSQIRVGKDGRIFRMFKFRTMRVDAEQSTGPVWAQKNDNRITLFGGVMRKMRLDELPQFINVLMGDMSLIGPRPERPCFVDKLKEQVPNYEQRLAVKPGITGLAQVRNSYDETIRDVKRKVRYDLFYIQKMNIWNDLKIMFMKILKLNL